MLIRRRDASCRLSRRSRSFLETYAAVLSNEFLHKKWMVKVDVTFKRRKQVLLHVTPILWFRHWSLPVTLLTQFRFFDLLLAASQQESESYSS